MYVKTALILSVVMLSAFIAFFVTKSYMVCSLLPDTVPACLYACILTVLEHSNLSIQI